MRLLVSEMRKIWGQRIFALCLAVLAAANLFLLYTGTKPGKYSAPASAYRAVSRDLLNKSTEEQQQFIKDRLDTVFGVLQVEQLLSREASGNYWGENLREEYSDVFENYEETYRSKAYELYTGNLQMDYTLLSQIKSELDTVAGYPQFLEEVQAKAEQLAGISIFKNSKSGYNQKNIDKTAQVYAGMGNVKIRYAPQKGLFTALDYQFTDLILLAAMLLMASLLVRQERDNGMLSILRSTPGGRLKTALAKLAALALSMLAVLIMMYGVNLTYCGLTFGLGPLGRSIQSVPALMRCTMQITVAEYLGRFLLAKWAGSFVMGLWVMLAMLWAGHTYTGWLGALALPAVQWIVRNAIAPTSRWNVVRYANLSSLMRTNELLGNYRNLYWFDSPIGLPLVEWSAAVLYGSLIAGSFLLLFSRGQLRKTPAFAGFVCKNSKTRPTTVFRQEFGKLYLLSGAMAILVLFAGYQIWNAARTETYFNAEQIYYAYYMRQLEGPYTADTRQKLEELDEEFEPIYELQRSLQSQKITSASYEMQMNSYYGLQEKQSVFSDIVYRNLSYIQEHPKAHLIYEDGWKELFGLSGNSDLQEVLWAGLLSCICFGGLFAFEKKGGMQRVVMAAPLGRRNTVRAKLLVSTIGAGFVTVLTAVPRLVIVLRDYWLSCPFAPAMSLQEFSNVPEWIPVAGILVWGVLGRIIACMTMMMLLLWLSDRLGSALAAVFVGSLILCLPPMLALSGLGALRWVGLYPLFHFAVMAQSGPDSLAGALCALLCVLLCWLCKENLYERWKCR